MKFVITIVMIDLWGIVNESSAIKFADENKTFQCEITNPAHLSEKGKEMCAELLAKKEQES